MSRQTTVRQRGTRPGIRAAVRRRRLLTAAIAVVLITVAAATAGELIARQLIRDKTAGKLAALGDIKVSENGSLALWDLLDRHIPQLDITGDDATLGPFRQVAVQAQLDGVALGATPAISSAHAVITVPDPSIAAAVQTRAPRVKVSSVTSDPAAGTVTVAIGPGGIGSWCLSRCCRTGRSPFRSPR